MTQLPLQESNQPVEASMDSIMTENERRIALAKVGLSLPSLLPAGPHGAVRAQLMWANKLLAYDQSGSISRISVLELKAALLAFLRDLRVGARGGTLGAAGSSGDVTPPRSPGYRRSARGSQSVRTKTRNFKN